MTYLPAVIGRDLPYKVDGLSGCCLDSSVSTYVADGRFEGSWAQQADAIRQSLSKQKLPRDFGSSHGRFFITTLTTAHTGDCSGRGISRVKTCC